MQPALIKLNFLLKNLPKSAYSKHVPKLTNELNWLPKYTESQPNINKSLFTKQLYKQFAKKKLRISNKNLFWYTQIQTTLLKKKNTENNSRVFIIINCQFLPVNLNLVCVSKKNKKQKPVKIYCVYNFYYTRV